MIVIVLAIAPFVGGLLGGGALVRLCIDMGPQSENSSADIGWSAAGVATAIAAASIAGVLVIRRHDRQTGIKAAALATGTFLAIGMGEVIGRWTAPAWPARALHGVSPRLWAAATGDAAGSQELPVGINSWGQRDRERSIVPARGTRRVAFIGDSYLEEGSLLPVSLATEEKIGRPDFEIVNLGVSATGPDEYFDRLRDVALPLRADHCCLFVFAGNDFVSPARTLRTWLGVAAVEPRPSLLTVVGLSGWNYLVTNRDRPVIRAWLDGSSLAAAEKSRSTVLKQSDDRTIRRLLMGAVPLSDAARTRLAIALTSDDADQFFDMLRHPDQDQFRSYYLTDALLAASQPGWQWEPNNEEMAWQWTERAAQLCRSRNISLTVVMVPEGFQVDDRMRDQWLPLADMRLCTAPCREAAARFVNRARRAGLDMLDLHETLQGTRGTYLNLDGHWSEAGVEVVSTALARHLTDGTRPLQTNMTRDTGVGRNGDTEAGHR